MFPRKQNAGQMSLGLSALAPRVRENPPQKQGITWGELPPFAPERCDLKARLQHLNIGEDLAFPHAILLRSALRSMEEHAHSTPMDEVMGVLFGAAWQDETTEQTATVIEGITPIQGAHSTRTNVALSHASWAATWSSLPASAQVVGWYHSHPGHGIFFSATDRQTQRLYFKQPWEIGFVLDPLHGKHGAFASAGCTVCDVDVVESLAY